MEGTHGKDGSARPPAGVCCAGATVGTLEEFDALPEGQRQEIFEDMLGHKLRGSEGGTWVEFSNIDIDIDFSNLKIIGDWKKKITIEKMQRIVEKNNWSAITVGWFGHAALKNFDFPLTPDHCRPAEGCTIYIYTPPSAFTKTGKPPEPPKAVPADPEAEKLVLVKAGSPEQCVFEHSHKLAAGEEFVPLTLQSGKAIVDVKPMEDRHAHYHILWPGVGDADVAIRARLDKDGFLTREDNAFVFDVGAFETPTPGNKLSMLREHEDATQVETRRPGGGRSFQINSDGTISPVKAPELVLGAMPKKTKKKKCGCC